MLIIVLGLIALGSYFLFRDTMNKAQYIERLNLYWITRNTGVPGSPLIKKAWMRQTSAPYWRGKGVEVRIRSLTFQVGLLTMRVDSLDSQLSSKQYLFDAVQPNELRQW